MLNLATVTARTENAARRFAWKALRHASCLGDEAYLDRIAPPAVGCDQTAHIFLDELRVAPEVFTALTSDDAVRWARQHARLSGTPGEDVIALLDFGGVGRARALLLYAALRRRQPSLVIETGCFTGWDTTLILLALKRNGHGHLYTLDLPGYSDGNPGDTAFQASLPFGGLSRDLRPGFLVPETLRDRWTLRLGDARALLPALLDELTEPVDVFFHDSEHSYLHMMWEYTTVAPCLAASALLASDDISFNTAFQDFCAALCLPRVLHRENANLGATVWRT